MNEPTDEETQKDETEEGDYCNYKEKNQGWEDTKN